VLLSWEIPHPCRASRPWSPQGQGGRWPTHLAIRDWCPVHRGLIAMSGSSEKVGRVPHPSAPFADGGKAQTSQRMSTAPCPNNKNSAPHFRFRRHSISLLRNQPRSWLQLIAAIAFVARSRSQLRYTEMFCIDSRGRRGIHLRLGCDFCRFSVEMRRCGLAPRPSKTQVPGSPPDPPPSPCMAGK